MNAIDSKQLLQDYERDGVPAKFHPLPESLAGGNLPEQLLPQTDLWEAQRDDSWKDQTPPA